jgi:hypothetical protein
MSLDTTQTETDIINRIKTVLPRVYITEVPDGTDPGDPYVVVYFGEPSRIGTDHHLTSTRNDTLRGFLTIQVISRTDAAASAIKNRIKNALVGFRPADSGEIIAEGGLSYSEASTSGASTKYYRELGFSYMTNLTWVSS